MLMIAVIAAVAALPIADRPVADLQIGGSTACGVPVVKIEFVPTVPTFGWSPDAIAQVRIVSKIVDEKQNIPPEETGRLPLENKAGRDPAVLLPKCQEEARPKRKRRQSDYPMA